MTNFIPIFPLTMIVFPGEEVNLHIFEPRYKQLIKECFGDAKPFGIPPVVNKRIGEMGTLVKVIDLVKEYENGEMDIRIKGISVFRVLEIIKSIPGKLYTGAIVNYPENTETGSLSLMTKVLTRLKAMHKLLNINKSFKHPDEELTAYDIAHHAGLSIEEEQELLSLTQEIHRQEYLNRHLKRTIIVLQETENLKERIKLNGHFRDAGSPNF